MSKPGPPALDERVHRLEVQVKRVLRVRREVLGVAAIIGAALGALGISLYGEVKGIARNEAKQRVPELVKEAAEEELKRIVPEAVERHIGREIGEQRPAIEKLVRESVEDVMPAARCRWMIEELGGNVTEGSRGLLERVNLSDSDVTDEGLRKLSSCPGVSDDVKILSLRNTSITADGVTSLKQWRSLEELDITGTRATRRDVEALHLPRLTTVRADK